MNQKNDFKTSVQWLIKTESKKNLGPYSTEAVLKLIAQGAFAGTEKIKRYPDGKWTAISKQPDFYDKLLEALEEVPKNKQQYRPETQDRVQAETVIIPRDSEAKNYSGFDSDETIAPKSDSQPSQSTNQTNQRIRNQANPKIESGGENFNSITLSPPLEMTTVSNIRKHEKKAAVILPLTLLGVVILGAITLLLWPEQNSVGLSEKLHLLAPRVNSGVMMKSEDVRAGIQHAVRDYTEDSFESYLDAQNKLVTVIEGAPQNIEARGTLCLVYKELWPWAKQDSQDLEAIYSMSKSTRSLDPTGINGIYCEIVKLMTQGKYKEARGVVEYALNQPSLATAPVLYQIKAELLFEERDIKTAVLYAEKAKQLWPEWVKPEIDWAKYLNRIDRHAEATAGYQAVLQKNPKHKVAQIDYGIILFKEFHQTDDALHLLSTALSTPGKVSRGDQARAHFFLALAYSEKKDAGKAQENAKAAYKLNPSDPQFKELVSRLGGAPELASSDHNELVFLGDQHARSGNCLVAQAEYKAAFELDSTNATAAMKAGRCLWQINQSSEAVLWLKKALQADPKLTSAYVLLADYQSERFDYYSAIQSLNKATVIFPNDHEILKGYGLVEFRRNNMKDAVSYLQRAFKIYENDIENLILLTKASTSLGDFSAAQKYAVRAIELDATNPDAQIVYARVLTEFQGLETGVLYLRDLINKFSYTVEFRLALAELYREHERYSQAQKFYEQLVDADPKNKKARLGLGLSLQGQAVFDKALKQFLAASVVDPSDAEALFRAGKVYLEIEKYPEAVTQFKRAQTVNSLFPRLNYWMGRAFFQMGQYDQALKASAEERKINPNLADSYILAAEVYTATKQFQKCAAEYQLASKLRPQGAILYVQLARCYRQSGSPDIAESMLNIAASQESGMPEIYKEQGAIYQIKGDARASIQAYSKYLALSPNAPDKKQIEFQINQMSGH